MRQTIINSEMTEEQKSYLNFLNSIGDSVNPFTNSGSEHAQVLMHKIFDQTENELKIYARGLYPDLTGTPIYMEGLEKYVKKGGTIKVLLEEDTFKNEPTSALHYLLNQKKTKVECRLLNEDSITKIQEYFIGYDHCNFTIGDDRIFRYETNPKNFEAIGNFNDERTVNTLSQIFNRFFIDACSSPIS